MPECPLCNRTFTQAQIQRHANQCLDDMMRGVDVSTENRPVSPPPPPPEPIEPPVAPPRPRRVSDPIIPVAGRAPSPRPTAAAAAPRTQMRVTSAGRGRPANGRSAPSTTKDTPRQVTESEVDELLNAIRVNPSLEAQERHVVPAPATIVESARVEASWTPTASSFKPITGEIYVKILAVELPLAKDRLFKARTPYVDVEFEKDTYTTAAPVAWKAGLSDGLATFIDEEFIFPVTHYYGGAHLTLSVYERGIFGRTACGKLELSASDIVHHQLALFRNLNIAIASDATGHLAMQTKRDPLIADSDQRVQGWFSPGSSPTTVDLWQPLSNGLGRVHLQLEFVFPDTKRAIGQREMKLMHRAAAGGHIKLLRFVWAKSNAEWGTVDSRTADDLRPLDLAVSGSTEGHTQCVSFLLHCMNNDVESDGTLKSSVDTLRRHAASGRMCLSKYTSSASTAMRLQDSDLRPGNTTVVHRAAKSGSAEILCMLLVPPTAVGFAKTQLILACEDHLGRTPALVAAAAGNLPVLDMLQSIYGFNSWKQRDLKHNDALLLAATGGHVVVVQFLLRNGAPGTLNTCKESALHLAAGCPHDTDGAEIIRLLSKAGFATGITITSARPLHYAVRSGNPQCVAALISEIHDPVHAEDNSGYSPFDLLVERATASDGSNAAWVPILKLAESSLTPPQLKTAWQRWNSRASLRAGIIAPVISQATDFGITTVPPVVLPTRAPLLGAARSTSTGGTKSASIWDDDNTQEEGFAEDDAYAYVEELSLPAGRPAFSGKTSSVDGLVGTAAPPNPLTLARQRSVEVYDMEGVVELQTRLLNEVSSLLKLPMAATGILLRQFKWDAQAVTDAYIADSSKLLKSYGVREDLDANALLAAFRAGRDRDAATTSANKAGKAAKLRLVHVEDQPKEMCLSCLEEVPKWKLISLGCDHVICSDCWQKHFTASFEEHGKDVFKNTKCHDASCGIVVPELFWQELAREVDYAKYRQFVMRSFVPLTGQVVWCPNPKCTRALRYRNPHSDLTCLCGMRFCVSCQLEAHSPCTCEEYCQWKEDSDGLKDVLTMRLLMESYKKCPKCGVFMERTQGCNHITCKCGHQWCFMCKADWSTHGSATGGYFRCNIYEASKSKKHVDWEGYSAEDRAKYLGDSNQSRAKLFEETQAKVKTQDDGMQAVSHKLEIARKAVTDPQLLLKKHSVKRAAIAAVNATVAAKRAPGQQPEVTRLRRALLDGITKLTRFFDTALHDDTSSDEDKSPHKGSGTAAATALTSAPDTSIDAMTAHLIFQETKRLAALVAALEALYEFHRVEKWCHVHLFYMISTKDKVLLEFKQETLERHASTLFEMLSSNAKLASLDEAALKEYTETVKKFCRNLLDEVETNNAYKGRNKMIPSIAMSGSGVSESKHE